MIEGPRAATSAELPAVIQLSNSVCTLDAHRGKGLAARLMEDAISAGRAQGAVVAFISGRRGLYRRMGCIDAGLFQAARVQRRSSMLRMRCHVGGWAPADIGEMASLQRAEGVRFIRGEAETLTLLSTGRVFVRPGATWVIRAGGSMVAWLSAACPAGSDGETRLAVHEIAGSRLAVLSALPRILRDCRLPAADITVASPDVELETLAGRFGLRVQRRGFPGTLKIIDAPALFRSLEGWIAERLDTGERRAFRVEAGERVVFSAGCQALTMENPGDLEALVFGSVERPPPAPPPGPLADILARIFPVTIPWYGLNYI